MIRFFVLSLLCLALLVGCRPDAKEVKQKQILPPAPVLVGYNRVIASNELRCGYIINPPHFVQDQATGSFSGTFFDITNEMAKRLNLKVQWIATDWSSYIQDMKLDRFDMLCSGAWSQAADGRDAGFSRPLFYTPIFVYVRGNDSRFDDNMAKLNSYGIMFAVTEGSTAAAIRKSDFPESNVLLLAAAADISGQITSVATAKADATLLEPYTAQTYLKVMPNAVRPLFSNKPLRIFPNRFVMPLGDVRLHSMIDITLEEMQDNGVTDKIISKYETFPGSYIRALKAY